MRLVKTTRPTTKGLHRSWYLLDASKEPLGRLASNKYQDLCKPFVVGLVVLTNRINLVDINLRNNHNNTFIVSSKIIM